MRKRIGFVLVSLLMAAGLVAQQRRQGEIELQAAIRTETFGDLKGAIKQYENIVKKYSRDEAVTAQALIHMAQSQEKLGDANARKIYERVVREYPNQKVQVAAANAWIQRNASGLSSHLSNRPVWRLDSKAMYPYDDPSIFGIAGQISKDGRFLPWENVVDGEIYLHDFSLGVDRRLTYTAKRGRGLYTDGYEGNGANYYFAFSKDAKELAYSWQIAGHQELRVISFEDSGIPQPRVVINDPGIHWMEVYDWSSENEILVMIGRQQGPPGQLAIVTVPSRTIRPISISEKPAGPAFFSPDGKFIAFQAEAPPGVIVLAVDTKREIPAAMNKGDKLVGWSPDGKQLVIESDRVGGSRLWTLSIDNGRIGPPKPIAGVPAAINDVIGFSASGSLYYNVRPAQLEDAKSTSMDFATGRVLATPVSLGLQTGFVGNPPPVLSPDGKYFAYTRDSSGARSIVVRSLDNGPDSELKGPASGLLWSPDSGSLAYLAITPDRPGSMKVIVADGQMKTTRVVASYDVERAPGSSNLVTWNQDNKLFLRKLVAREAKSGVVSVASVSVIELDLTSETQREVLSMTGTADMAGSLTLAPDGRTAFFRRPAEGSGPPFNLIARDLASGVERTLSRLQDLTPRPMLSPDGRFIVAGSQGDPATKTRRLLLIRTNGEDPQELPPGIAFVMWSPDSRSILGRKPPEANAASSRPTYWWIPVDGSPGRQLDLDVAGEIGEFAAQGNRLLFVERFPQPRQVWVLENFLPGISTK